MIVVEMNVTIIAASVVVMRPCFQAIFDVLFPTSRYAGHNLSNWGTKSLTGSRSRSRRSDGYIISPDEQEAGQAGEAAGSVESNPGIVKTVAIEMASDVASTDDILKGSKRAWPLSLVYR